MKKFLFIMSAIIILGIWGCDNNSSDNTTTTTQSQNDQTTTTKTDGNSETSTPGQTVDKEIADEDRGAGQIIGKAGVGDAKRLGVDKTLVWIVPDVSCPKDSVVNMLNDLLVNKYGCDFVVEFNSYLLVMNYMNENYTYADMVLDMKNLGHQADVLYSGNYFDYDSFVNEGIYIPLTEYFVTDEGQKLYNAYAPEIWKKTARDGHSYGYVSEIYPSYMAVALCNEEIAKKYGITVPSGEWSFYDIGKYMETSSVIQESVNSEATLLSCRPEALLLMEGYQTFDTFGEGIFFKEDGNGGWTAVNPAGEDNFMKLLQTVKEYADKGWYSNVLDKNATDHKQMGRFAFSFDCVYAGGIMFADNKFVRADATICNVLASNESYAANETISNMINGITSWSEYKDEALKLVTLVNTEAELSNLLKYGIEGEDYKYENRLVLSTKTNGNIDMPSGSAEIANLNLLYSVLADPDDKLAYSKEISANFPDAPTMIYDFDMSAYEKQLREISGIYSKYSDPLFMGGYDDVEAAIAEMRRELSAAGIDEVIAEINKQMQK